MTAPTHIPVEIKSFDRSAANTSRHVLGYVSVSAPAIGMDIYNMRVTHINGVVSVLMPKSPLMRKGAVMLGESGNPVERNTVRFHDKELFHALAKGVVVALRAAYPHVMAAVENVGAKAAAE